jgi:hypothetical protein
LPQYSHFSAITIPALQEIEKRRFNCSRRGGIYKQRFQQDGWDWLRNFAGFEGIEGFGAKSVGLWRESVAILFSVVTVKIEHGKTEL